jgi:DNA-binding NarL/FixJ family response regulator
MEFDDDVVVGQLTDRESVVLRQVAAGRRNREIAESLHVTVKTVEFHLSHILAKLNVRSRTEAVIRAWRIGLLQNDVS